MGNDFSKSTLESDSGKPAIADCSYNFDSATQGIFIPQNIKKELELIDVYYFSFDKKLHKGQILINKELAGDVKIIFEEIRKSKFPVKKVIPIAAYNWSDSASMEDNNSSAFNYRFVKGTKRLSNHATGRAVDINPLQNPQIKNDEMLPANGSYEPGKPGTITENSFIVKLFKKKGWSWGGDWKSSKDYQHFEKVIEDRK